MADPRVELVIRARDEATSAFNRVIREVQALGNASKASAAQAASLSRMGDALSAVSPAAAAASSQVRMLSSAMGGLSASTTVALGAVGALLALGAGAVAAAKGIVTLSAEAEQLGNLAQKAGVAASNLSALQLRAEQLGVPAEALANSLRFLNRSIVEQDPALRKLGVTQRDTYAALVQLADAFSRAPDGPAKTAIAMKLLGRGGAELIPVLNQGGAALAAFVAKARATGSVLGDQTVGQLQRLDDAVDSLRESVGRLRNAFVTLVAPALTDAVSALAAFGERLRLLPTLVLVTVSSLQLLGAAITSWASSLAEAVPGVGSLLGLVGANAEQATARFSAAMEKMREQVRALAELAKSAAAGGGKATVMGMSPEEYKAWAARMDEAAGKADKVGLSLKQMLEVAATGAELPKLRSIPVEGGGKLGPTGTVAIKPLEFTEAGKAEQVRLEWVAAMDEITSSATVMDELLTEVFQALSASFYTAFQQIASGAATFGSLMRTIFKGMVDAVLAELARLMAAQALKLLLKIVGFALGGPVGAAVGVGAGAAIDSGIGGAFEVGGALTRAGEGAGVARSLDRLANALSSNVVRVDRNSFLDTVGNAMVQRDRRAALAQGY